MPTKTILDCLVIFLLAQLLLAISIGSPSEAYFDEVHYVKAAKQIWEFIPNKNIEHPPLGKALIGLGILGLGDTPLGWRIMSTCFGALTLVGIFLIAHKLLHSRKWSYAAVLFTLLSHAFVVESRLAVIDPFMAGFLIFGLYGYCSALDNPRGARVTGWLIFSGACFGLSAACKWSSIPVYAFCLVYLLGKHLLTFGNAPHSQMLGGAFWMVLAPLVFYFIAFTPYFFVGAPGYGLSDFWQMQTNIWTAQMLTPGTTPYRSAWYEWPLMLKPYWYIFTPSVEGGFVRGILFAGNPVIFYGGLLSMLHLGVRELRKPTPMLILPAAFLVLWLLPWSILDREASFLYYYYPASLLFGVSLAACFATGMKSASRFCLAYSSVAAIAAALMFPFAAYLAIPLPEFQTAAKWLPPVYIWRVDQ